MGVKELSSDLLWFFTAWRTEFTSYHPRIIEFVVPTQFYFWIYRCKGTFHLDKIWIFTPSLGIFSIEKEENGINLIVVVSHPH